MLKSFGWTLIFTVGFTVLNSIGDASQFYKTFKYYKRPGLWHSLKFGWMACAVGVGWFLNDLIQLQSDIVITAFLLLFFCSVRWGLHEALMWKWRQE